LPKSTSRIQPFDAVASVSGYTQPSIVKPLLVKYTADGAAAYCVLPDIDNEYGAVTTTLIACNQQHQRT
jgi:hypothetical protein